MKSSEAIQARDLPPATERNDRAAGIQTNWKDTPISQGEWVFDVLAFAVREGEAEARSAGLHDELDKLLDDEELENFHLKMQAATRRLMGADNSEPTPKNRVRTFACDSIPCNVKPCTKKQTLL